jgi:iron complex outermembrane receptor protein
VCRVRKASIALPTLLLSSFCAFVEPSSALAEPAAAEPAAAAVPAAEDNHSENDPEEDIEVFVRGDTAGAYVSRASIDRSLREPVDAASVLAELPSVHVRRLGAEGSLATMSIRGSASSQVGAVLASIPLTSAADPSLDVGSLPLWPGASFRVYRGFAPASLGTTGYLGGVLAIDPPSAANGERTEWWAAAGSFGSLKVRAGDVRVVRGVTLGTGLFASRSDGDFTFEVTDAITGKLVEKRRENARYASAGGIGRASIELGWGSVGLTVLADARRQGLPGTATFPATFARLESSRIVAGADVLVRTARGALRGALWGRRETSSAHDPFGELDPTRAGTRESAVLAAGGSIGWRGRPLTLAALSTLLVSATLDARAERFTPSAQTSARGRAGTNADRLAAGLGLELEWKPLAPLTLSASGRIDARRDETAAGVGPNPSAEVPGVATDLAPSGHAGASLRINDAAILSVHGGALWRPPSFFELFGDRGSLVGDPALRPERAASADLGLHGAAGDSGAQVSYEAVGFVTYARDLIAFIPLGRSTFRARNVEQARIAGAELSAALSAKGLRTQISYTLLATENLSDHPLANGRKLPGRPLHDLAYDASYRIGPVRVRYGLDAVAGTTVDVEGTRVLPARVLHSAGISARVPFLRGLQASLEAQNLFDLRTLYVSSTYRPVAMPVSDFLGFPLPGRTLWAAVRFTSER